MMRRGILALLLLAAGCGKDSTGPSYGIPQLVTVNGVTQATGMVGMTVILEGNELAESRFGSVYFLGSDGARVPAEPSDWSNAYIIATVPHGTAAESKVWVETQWGSTDSLSFQLITASTFSPSLINWTRTVDLPQALQGLAARFVPVVYGAHQSKYIFTVGGASDGDDVAQTAVYRGLVLETGAISAWDEVTALPAPRAYHALAAATPYTARLDTTTAAYLYAIGGIDATGATVNTVLRAGVGLDGAVGSWQTAAPLPAAVHSAAAVAYRGYLYVVGGADEANAPVAAGYRASIETTGSLGSWESIPALPTALAHHKLVNFGPLLYVVGGNSAAIDPAASTPSGSEVSSSYRARIDMRDGTLPGWSTTSSPGKGRGKHGIMSAGGAVVITSGMYSGQDGSSENSYATINADGTLSSWGGATGSSTILSVLGYSLFNAAAVSFVDAAGNGHVVVLGGGRRGSTTGAASAAVVYY
jgi:hypothetical protein